MIKQYVARYSTSGGEIKPGDMALEVNYQQICKYVGANIWINPYGKQVDLPNWQTRFMFKKVEMYVFNGETEVGKLSEAAAPYVNDGTELDPLNLIWSIKDENCDEVDRVWLNESNNPKDEDRIMVRCPWGCFH